MKCLEVMVLGSELPSLQQRLSPIAAVNVCKWHSSTAFPHIVAKGPRDVYVTTPTSFLTLFPYVFHVSHFQRWFHTLRFMGIPEELVSLLAISML